MKSALAVLRWLPLGAVALALGCGSDNDSACERGNCGAAGTPGSAGSAPYVNPCLSVLSADGTSPLIDDFETNSGLLIESEHRVGSWYTFDDESGVTSPDPDTYPTLPEPDATRAGSNYALHFTGSGHRRWGGGAGFFFLLDSLVCYDASAYGGFRFWARGPGTVEVWVTTFETEGVDFDGGCENYASCYPHTALVALSAEWAEYTLQWSDFFQAVGPEFALDNHTLKYVSFQTVAATSWDFWFDDVAFAPSEQP